MFYIFCTIIIKPANNSINSNELSNKNRYFLYFRLYSTQVGLTTGIFLFHPSITKPLSTPYVAK